MVQPVEQAALMQFLNKQGPKFYHKSEELRSVVEEWLAYVPATFMHYTQHTIQHSDEIIWNISALLFRDDNPDDPVIHLSAVEAYVLIASAYLHDAGMVVSDDAKSTILVSDSWIQFIEDGPGRQRWIEIQDYINGTTPEESLRFFLADVWTRFLLADYIRRTHHLRAHEIIQAHELEFGRFAFGDPILRNTVADLCLSHGLHRERLDDQYHYPHERTVQHQPVNVRLMSILLRLGDLLDLRWDRADPLLLNAACPIPADSYARWTKYQRINDLRISIAEIRISAECETQEEHRFLQDWCQWIVDEVQNAGNLMIRADRHGGWIPPRVSLGGENPTIIIKPISGATYIPSDWKFELDTEKVFDRLIYDVYESGYDFVRELIQNACDANRCQMYDDLQQNGIVTPSYPTEVDENIRNRYSILVELKEIEFFNDVSGQQETRQVLIIDDSGIGMDREIIQHYLLQVGRSFYQTDEFRRRFSFVPTSRFGIGFLSVLGAGYQVTVDSYCPSSPSKDGPICIKLTGPRNYLLTDKGTRKRSGTRVEVFLKEHFKKGRLTELLENWCRRVEFPICIDDLGNKKEIISEKEDDFTWEVSFKEYGERFSKFSVESLKIDEKGIKGELYLFTATSSVGKRLILNDYEFHTFRSRYESEKERLKNSITFHGIYVTDNLPTHLIEKSSIDITDVSERSDEDNIFKEIDLANIFYRLDLRSSLSGTSISRGRAPDSTSLIFVTEIIVDHIKEYLSEHMDISPWAKGPEGWIYRQNLIDKYFLGDFWKDVSNTIRVFIDEEECFLSLREIMDLPLFTTVEVYGVNPLVKLFSLDRPKMQDLTAMLGLDALSLSARSFDILFKYRAAQNVRLFRPGLIAIDWQKTDQNPWLEEAYRSGGAQVVDLPSQELLQNQIVDLPSLEPLMVRCLRGIEHNQFLVLLNRHNEFVNWLLETKGECEKHDNKSLIERVKTLKEEFLKWTRWITLDDDFRRELYWWQHQAKLPEYVTPPDFDIEELSLLLKGSAELR